MVGMRPLVLDQPTSQRPSRARVSVAERGAADPMLPPHGATKQRSGPDAYGGPACPLHARGDAPPLAIPRCLNGG
jgi:hypothetical protein